MRDHDDLPYIVIERRGPGLAPFLWGALLGACAALLLAPRAGHQTQADIRRTVNRARTAAEDRIETVRSTVNRTRDRVEGGIETVRDRVDSVKDRIDTVRDRVDARTDQARDTIESGRRIAHDTREEIGRRVDEAKETYHAAADRIGHAISGEDDRSIPRGEGADVVIVDVTEERTEGRSDLG